MRMRVKICGITRVEDAQAAAAHGADAIGLIFYRPQPALGELQSGAGDRDQRSALRRSVAVFVNPARGDVERVISECGVTLLQFHGDEPPSFARVSPGRTSRLPRIRPGLDLLKYLSPYGAAPRGCSTLSTRISGVERAVRSMGSRAGAHGEADHPSGGLTAGNVAGAIRHTRPYAVDVSSSVEASKESRTRRKSQLLSER